jgi:hypothetical protein
MAVNQSNKSLVLAFEIGPRLIQLAEHALQLLLHDRGARDHKLGLQDFELGDELIAIGARHCERPSGEGGQAGFSGLPSLKRPFPPVRRKRENLISTARDL